MFENIPKAVFLLSSRGDVEILGRRMEKDNLMALDWMTPLSKEPPIVAIAIKKERFSYGLIKESGVFVLNMLPYGKKQAADICGRERGEFIDKFAKARLKKEEAKTIHCAKLIDASFTLECEVIDELAFGDHQLFVAKVVHADGKGKNPLIHHMREYLGVRNGKG